MIGLIIVPFVGVMSLPFGRRMKKLSKRVQDELAQSTSVSFGLIESIFSYLS